jgi:hypothetical protein
MTPEGITPFEAPAFIREKTGERLSTLGIAGEILRMRMPRCEAGDLIRGPVRNHPVSSEED